MLLKINREIKQDGINIRDRHTNSEIFTPVKVKRGGSLTFRTSDTYRDNNIFGAKDAGSINMTHRAKNHCMTPEKRSVRDTPTFQSKVLKEPHTLIPVEAKYSTHKIPSQEVPRFVSNADILELMKSKPASKRPESK